MTRPGIGVTTETFEVTPDTQATTLVVPRTEQVAHYMADDLRYLVQRTGINLRSALNITSDDYLDNSTDLVDLLFVDIASMLADGLITGVHLLLAEPELDRNAG